MAVETIAEQVQCSQVVVDKVIRLTVQKENDAERNAKIIQLHQQGMTNKAIAEQAGCVRQTVARVLSNYKKSILIQEKQKEEKQSEISANQAFSNVNLALKKIDFLSLLIASRMHGNESAKKEFQKALQKLISMNETAEEILEICEKTEELMLESRKREENGN